MDQITSIEQLDGLEGSITINMKVEVGEDGKRDVLIHVPEIAGVELSLDISGLTPQELRSTCDIGIACLRHVGILLSDKFANFELMNRTAKTHNPDNGYEM
jgi:hypothetical protein